MFLGVTSVVKNRCQVNQGRFTIHEVHAVQCVNHFRCALKHKVSRRHRRKLLRRQLSSTEFLFGSSSVIVLLFAAHQHHLRQLIDSVQLCQSVNNEFLNTISH